MSCREQESCYHLDILNKLWNIDPGCPSFLMVVFSKNVIQSCIEFPFSATILGAQKGARSRANLTRSLFTVVQFYRPGTQPIKKSFLWKPDPWNPLNWDPPGPYPKIDGLGPCFGYHEESSSIYSCICIECTHVMYLIVMSHIMLDCLMSICSWYIQYISCFCEVDLLNIMLGNSWNSRVD